MNLSKCKNCMTTFRPSYQKDKEDYCPKCKSDQIKEASDQDMSKPVYPLDAIEEYNAQKKEIDQK